METFNIQKRWKILYSEYPHIHYLDSIIWIFPVFIIPYISTPKYFIFWCISKKLQASVYFTHKLGWVQYWFMAQGLGTPDLGETKYTERKLQKQSINNIPREINEKWRYYIMKQEQDITEKEHSENNERALGN